MDKETGVIGKYTENGFPVIVSFESDLPSPETVEGLPWLAVVAWQYEDSVNNGLPSQELRKSMVVLEDAIETYSWASLIYRAYGRTGNGLKELAYYTKSQQTFLEGVNAALAKFPRFPISITFYADETWEDLKQLQADFAGKA